MGGNETAMNNDNVSEPPDNAEVMSLRRLIVEQEEKIANLFSQCHMKDLEIERLQGQVQRGNDIY